MHQPRGQPLRLSSLSGPHAMYSNALFKILLDMLCKTERLGPIKAAYCMLCNLALLRYISANVCDHEVTNALYWKHIVM